MEKKCKDCKISIDVSLVRCTECNKIFKHKIYLRNKEKTLKRKKEKYHKDINLSRKKNREYYKLNKTKINESIKKYKKRKRKEDPIFKFKENIRGLIRRGFKNNNFEKDSRTYEILGCTYAEFIIHIETQFEDWMTWDNYGIDKRKKLIPTTTWDIDHIIPLSTAKTKEDVIRLNHYTNLQPLCSYYNRLVKKF